MTISKLLLAAAVAAPAVAFAAPASAQRLAAPVVAVVDAEKVMADCNACKTANTQLQAQLNQVRQYAQQVGAPLQTEGQSLDAAIKAANGKPDAALTTRIEAWQGKQQQAQRQVDQQQATFQRNVQYVRQQIGEKLIPVVAQVSQQRGATMTIDKNSLLFSAASMEITDAVLAALNQQLTVVNVVAPPPAPAQGAAAPTTQPTQPQSR
jgi:Skp family chaperone for outer membrane proteins